ncbi:MAG: hypothetical protein ACP5E9_09605 [Candidatus Methanospirareceae archaeon]
MELELKKSVTDRTYGILSLNHEEIEEIIEDTEHYQSSSRSSST